MIVPLRDDPFGLAVNEKLTVPLPEPEAPPVTTIQLALLVAVHEQPVGVVTPALPAPAAAATDADVADRV